MICGSLLSCVVHIAMGGPEPNKLTIDHYGGCRIKTTIIAIFLPEVRMSVLRSMEY